MEEKGKRLSVQSVILVVALIIGFISIIFQFGMKNVVFDALGIHSDLVISILKTGENLNAPKIIDEDGWSQEYPFYDEPAYKQEKIYSTRALENESSEGSGIGAKLARIYSMLDKYASEYFMLIDEAEVLSKYFTKALGMNLLTDSYGNLTYFQSDSRLMAERQYKSMENEISNIKDFASWLDEEAIEFLYVTIPSPVDPDEEEEQIASGYEEYTNVMADELLSGLNAEGIKTLDLRTKMKEEGRTWSEGFFPYDHHMLPSNGIWAAGKVSETIDAMMGTEADSSVFDISNYTVTESEPFGEGSFYITATIAYADYTSMPFLHPLFDTDFVKELPRYGLTIDGDFDNVIYAMYEYPEYNTWNHGIQPIKTVRNQNGDAQGGKILLLTESFSDVISPFLYCAYSDVDEIDLRLFDGSLQAYIEETKPVLVVCMYSAYEQNSSGAEALFEFD